MSLVCLSNISLTSLSLIRGSSLGIGTEHTVERLFGISNEVCLLSKTNGLVEGSVY